MDSSHAKSDMTEILPPELLSRIFRCSRSWLREEHSFDENDDREEFIAFGNSTYSLNPTKCPTLFRILLVCPRWRDIALAESRLWTDINIDDPPSPLLCFMLEYSRIQPLCFSGWTQISSPVVTRRFKTILNHISRIESLSLDFPGRKPAPYSSIMGELYSAVVSEPGLKALRIRWSERRRGMMPPSYRILDVPPFPPSLSSITLDRVLLSVSIPCEGITSFHMERAPRPWEYHLSDAMLDVIHNMPNLESLHIKYDPNRFHSFDIPAVELNPRVPPISLPRLRDFCFSGTPICYVCILPSLSIPVNTSRNIELCDRYRYHSGRVTEEPVIDDPRYFVSDVENILAARDSLYGRDETFRVHFSLLSVSDDFILRVLVTLAPKRRLASTTFDHVLNVNDDDNTALVLSIRYTIPFTPRYDLDHEELDEEERAAIHATILTFISTISRAFRTDAVDHLHLSSNVSIFPETISDVDSNHTDENSNWTPSFLNWTEIRSLHVEGKHTAEWIAPRLSETRRWADEKSVVVFPRLQELLLDKLDRAYYCDPDGYSHRELWSVRWKFDILDLGKSWERVFKVRASCEGMKLRGLVLVEGPVCGRKKWNDWHATLKSGGWIEHDNIRWAAERDFNDRDDCSSHGDEEYEKIEQSWGGVDCLDSDWYRIGICGGLCHNFCARSLE